jgi:hypothetical protein
LEKVPWLSLMQSAYFLDHSVSIGMYNTATWLEIGTCQITKGEEMPYTHISLSILSITSWFSTSICIFALYYWRKFWTSNKSAQLPQTFPLITQSRSQCLH